LSRRDARWDSDIFAFFVDPYYDRRSGFYFALDAAGTLYDGVLYNDEWDDDSWDGVWEGKVNIDKRGWTAEMRIPFSQLRFHETDKYVWGINFRRDIARRNERDYVVFTPKNGSGFVSRFVDLVGIREISPVRQIEVLPYVTTQAAYTEHDDGDPFNDGSEYTPRIGADFKIGIGTNLILDATVNPDFGQVEVDPAVVNLSDVETFFREKRPFFIEGSKIISFGQGGSRSNWSFNWPNPNFFYSRRIGRSPQGEVPDADFSDVPAGTDILGAAKLSGKIGDNWNLGAIQAITSREYADLQTDGQRSRAEVEPWSYYGIARLQKEFNEGRQALGFISTLTARRFDDARLRDELNSSAFTFGLDGWTFLDAEKMWVVTGWTGMSHVRGNNERMTSLQENSRHYFQRPDASHVSVDSSVTSLTGYAGRLMVNKQKGNIFLNSALAFSNPKFEVNDLGFQSRTDLINGHVGAGYKWTEPTDFYRYIEVGGAVFRSYDFDENIIWEGVFLFGSFEFLNYYSIYWNTAYNPQTVNNRRTRGGPLTLNPPGYQLSLHTSSDHRKDLVLEAGAFTYQSDWSRGWEVSTEVRWRPSSNISVSVEPELERNKENSQWVDSFDDPTATATFGKRYVFAELNQTTISASIRLNWTFTPHLSLQLYAQPLISSGDYHNFKELARPKTYDFNVYDGAASTISLQDEEYEVDPDGPGPADSFTFDDPDFNLISLRGNAVLRWEYQPGSTIYFVWTQSRFDEEVFGDFQFNRSMRRLWSTTPDNIFMIKLTYWWSS
jgi:hypothetical protein